MNVIVPIHAFDDTRQRAWDRVRATIPYHVTVATCDGVWSKARAINAAVQASADEDILVLDADILIDWSKVRPANKGEFLRPFSRVYYMPQAETKAYYNGTPISLDKNWRTIAINGGGAFIMKKSDFVALGGFHEEYIGWGYEDADFANRLHGINRTVTDTPAYHLWHTPNTVDAQRNRELFQRRSQLNPRAAVKATVSIFHNNTPLPACRKGAFLAFNEPFIPYAAVLIHSILKNSPGWHIYAFCTNANPQGYPFNHTDVTLVPETKTFATPEDEKCYMNSRRFVRYKEKLTEVDLAVYLDADTIVLSSLDTNLDTPLGLVLRPHEHAAERQLRACTIYTTPAALPFWEKYEEALPAQTWYADQLALDAARKDTDVSVTPLPEEVFSSFKTTPKAKVLVTCTDDKLGFHLAKDYSNLYRRYDSEIQRANSARDVALVWVVFGADPVRLAAIRAGIAATAKLDLPGTIILLEASQTPSFNDLIIPCLTYRHIVPDERCTGVWQKEAMWEIARKMLRGYGAKYVVYMDADCTPTQRDYFKQIQALHMTGIKAAQPWHNCLDTIHTDIGGRSWCWAYGHQEAATGAQPGFCWSFDLAWLESIGGLPNVEPIGGGDSLLMNMIFDAKANWCPEAKHMRAIAQASKIQRQPFASIDVDLIHHSHGPRSNRQYRLRYRVADMVFPNLMSIYTRDDNGLSCVVDTHEGRAWTMFLSHRNEWRDDRPYVRTLWQQCLKETK